MRVLRLIIASVLVLAAAVFAGGVVASQFRGSDPQALHEALTRGEAVQVADIPAARGLAGRGVFVQETDAGQLCLWDAPSAASLQRGGGCNAIDDPLGGSALSASLAYEGGPGIENVRDARLIGLVAEDVATVAVLMSDGSERSVRLKEARLARGEFQAFGYRLERADLRDGIGPVAVIARDADGIEVSRQPTGIE